MSKQRKIVGVKKEGEPIVWHACVSISFSVADTLCGLAFDVDADRHQLIRDVPRGQKVTCRVCRYAWSEAKQFKLTDFDETIR